jgi:hypothetical protein
MAIWNSAVDEHPVVPTLPLDHGWACIHPSVLEADR